MSSQKGMGGKELTLSTCNPFNTNPPQGEHGEVVIDMKETNLVKFLPQDEEYCIQIFNSFRDIIPP